MASDQKHLDSRLRPNLNPTLTSVIKRSKTLGNLWVIHNSAKTTTMRQAASIKLNALG